VAIASGADRVLISRTGGLHGLDLADLTRPAQEEASDWFLALSHRA